MQITLVDANNYLRRKFESTFNVPSIIPLHTPGKIVFWVFDGKDALAARRVLYPEYKIKRDRETPTNNGAYAMLQAVRDELLPHTSGYITRVPGMEADDIIAYLANDLSRKGVNVRIESNDGDFHALTGPLVTLTTPPSIASEVAPQDVRLYKTLVGDGSDNIPGLKGFGEKAWKALSEGEKALWRQFFQDETRQEVWGPIVAMLRASQVDWFTTGGDKLLRTFWKIVGFLPVTEGLVNQHTVAGVANPAEYNRILRKYLWTI